MLNSTLLDDQENSRYTDLMPVDVSSFVDPINSVQSAQIDANRQIADPAKSIHLTP